MLSIERDQIAPHWAGESVRLRGLCLFDIFAEGEHAGWKAGPSGANRRAIFFGGSHAGMVACHEHGWSVTQCHHGYGEDRAGVELISREVAPSENEQASIKQEQERLSLGLVLAFWHIIAELGGWLAEGETIHGLEVNKFIQHALGPGHLDWRPDEGNSD
jgi:hypothetical protein